MQWIKRTYLFVFFVILVSGALLAQSANDVGVEVTNRPSADWVLPSEDAGAVLRPRGNALPPCATGITQFSGSNSQMGRIFRDAIPSSCPTKSYPGIFNPGTPYFFETFTYTNSNAAASCVTVNFDPNPNNNLATDCGTNAHASAYAGSYDPMNQSANFLGDVGSSITDSFAVEVPAMTDMVLVVTNTSAEEVCDFQFEVVNIDCEVVDADLEISKTADTPNPSPGGPLNYTVTVTNNGPSTAMNVTVTDNLPSGLTFVSTTGCAEDPNGVPTCSLGMIAPNSSAAYTIATTVDDPAPEVITNTASASADNADPVDSNNSTNSVVSTVRDIPVLDAKGLAVLGILLLAGGGLLIRRLS
ncbi:MAG TPA: DUF11 domain-containing protein [Acidobacteriota bacterium]|nr:DUF11 domain-containing protein [Acidobacteriota bacterium]